MVIMVNNIFCNKSRRMSTLASAIIVIVLYTSIVQCHTNETTSTGQINSKNVKRSSIRVCGVKLVNTLKKLCNHCYKEPQLIRADKRATDHLDEFEDRQEFLNRLKRLEEMSESDETKSDVIDMYIEKRLGGRNRRPKTSSTGIANKCCINQCGWTDLMSYCCKKPRTPPPPTDDLIR